MGFWEGPGTYSPTPYRLVGLITDCMLYEYTVFRALARPPLGLGVATFVTDILLYWDSVGHHALLGQWLLGRLPAVVRAPLLPHRQSVSIHRHREIHPVADVTVSVPSFACDAPLSQPAPVTGSPSKPS